MSVTFT